jgi:hypothetical protein
MKIKVFFVALVAFWSFSGWLLGQDTDEVRNMKEQYRLARLYYAEGKIDQTLQLLQQGCLAREKRYAFLLLRSETRANILELAASAAILLDHPDEVQRYIKAMLEIRPFYDKDNYSLPKMRACVDTMVIKAKWSIGFQAGVNAAFSQSVRSFSVLEPIGYQMGKGRFTPLPALAFGGLFEYGIGTHFTLAFAPSYVRLAYQYEQENISPRITSFGYKQRLNTFDLPIMLRYTFQTEKQWQPFVHIGAFYSYIGTSSRVPYAQIVRSEENSGSQLADNAAFLATTLLFLNNNYGLLAGTGIRYRLGRTSIGTSLTWQQGLGIVSNKNNRYNVNNFNFGYYDASNDTRLHQAYLSFHIIYAIRHRVF